LEIIAGKTAKRYFKSKVKTSDVSQFSDNGNIRVLLVEDHPVVRESLKRIIQQEASLSVCGEADDCKQALAMVEATKPHLVILDLTLRDSHGLELIKNLRDQHPKVLSLVFSMHEEILHAERAIRAGASGYITKQESPAKILLAIRQVLNGEIYWSEKAAARIASKIALRSRPSNDFSMELLTDRELQVFELMGLGQSTREIANSLHIDASTVDTYAARIKEKLNLKSRLELLQYAIRFQMLPKSTEI
jgi:DNA-binding NarL/FixJ family response regulator